MICYITRKSDRVIEFDRGFHFVVSRVVFDFPETRNPKFPSVVKLKFFVYSILLFRAILLEDFNKAKVFAVCIKLLIRHTEYVHIQ